jgi:endonuclease VIII-like 1
MPGMREDKRGPDPIKEFDLFKRHALSNLHKRIFKKPICEMLMNQQYFNGIGNYLRAMICHEAGCNPFMPSNKALVEYPQIFDYCRGMALQA